MLPILLRRLVLVLVCVAWLLPLPGAAQSRRTGAEPAGYRTAIGAAIEEFDLNHFTEAREHFARAHVLFPNARTLRGLGLCDFELRRYVAAVQYLKEALASDVKQLDAKLRKETEAMLTRAAGYVGTLRVRTQPAEALVSVDGISVTPAADGSMLLEVGDHVLEVRATGFVTQRRELQVRGGQDESVEIALAAIELQPEEVAAASPAAQRPASAPGKTARKPLYKQWWLWTAVGVVVAGAATGTAVALSSDKTTSYEPTSSANTPTGVSLQPLGVR
ncbi:MAG TPA: PEGA domain-containing protein [Polyangiales bacterium]